MLTLERQLAEMRDWASMVYALHPSSAYAHNIAGVWFEDIGPARAAQYGVLGLNELGIPGVLAQVLNCYYRWRHMESRGARYEEMEDVLVDVFGFSVLTGIVAEFDPRKIEMWPNEIWNSDLPTVSYLYLKTFAWGARDYSRVVPSVFMLSSSMYNSTWRRI